MFALILQNAHYLARRSDASAAPGCGCLVAIAVIAIVVFLVVKSRRDRQAAVPPPIPTAPRSADGQGPIGSHTFACPYPKCSNCGAAADKMRQQWDGLRKVTWTCSYCGAVQVQDLKDEELPPSARQRLGLDPGADPNQAVYPQQGGGGMMGGAGGLLTGMMIGSMMGGDRHHHDDDNWRNGGGSGGSGGDSGWGDSGGGDDGGWGDSGGGDWGDSGGGGDWGGD